ncbi:hypothetical protein [Pelagicoccus sp. SDUM812002]|uniref:hypothetical protein n=1 Tax=Pelagicoccus sp. SDUM812002 TaxID=3041266 RepID=UPI00280F7A55|nr:hypothetical protein [Pelagicoccus sp. SDUM812002]MDQ8187546.1 hypothetical protein [Pelagicoccus sp. SDUM812002]
MKRRILILITLIYVTPVWGAPGSGPSSEIENDPVAPRPTPTQQGTTLPDYISEIAEKDEITAEDYAKMASGTMQVAMQVMQQGEKMPDPPIEDALDAVAAGRDIDPEHSDWDQLEQRLLDLLNPPHQEQQPQEGESSEDQEEQQDGDDQQQDGSAGSSEESSENSEESDSESQGENSDEQQDAQQGEQGDQQQEGQEGEQESQDGQDQQNGEQSDEGESTQQSNTQDGAQMGQLDQNQDEQQVELDGETAEQPPERSPEQMQTLGGQQASGEPVDAETAALKQLLEQLRQQDQPGKLYQILQEAQTGGKKKQQPNAKDW